MSGLRRGSVATFAAVSALAVLLAVVGLGCISVEIGDPPEPEPTTPLLTRESARFIPAPKGAEFDNPVWYSTTKEIVAVVAPVRGDAAELALYAMQPDGSSLHRLPLAQLHDYRITSHDQPVALPDGRLGYGATGWGPEGDPSTVTAREGAQATALMAWDPRTGRNESVTGYRVRFQVGPFAFSPDMRTGVVNGQEGLYERLHRLGPRGLEPLELPLERSGWPAWSPDGRWIALDGVPDDESAGGPRRLDMPRTLYLLSAGDLHTLRPLIEDQVAISSAWSPDSRWLLVNKESKQGKHGLWLLNVASGKRWLLLEGDDLGSATWLPGNRFAVTVGGWSQFRKVKGPIGLYILRLPDLRRLPPNAAVRG